MRFLFFAFVVIPVVEMWVLIKVGSIIGALPTIGLVLLTAVIGVSLLRQQGLATLLRGRQRLEEGQLPATEIVEGLILAVCGALLLTPGFVTDTIGFAGLIPVSRRWFVRQVLSRVDLQSYTSYQVHRRGEQDDSAIDGEYWEEAGQKQDRDRRLP